MSNLQDANRKGGLLIRILLTVEMIDLIQNLHWVLLSSHLRIRRCRTVGVGRLWFRSTPGSRKSDPNLLVNPPLINRNAPLAS